jgi:hypothetical protein
MFACVGQDDLKFSSYSKDHLLLYYLQVKYGPIIIQQASKTNLKN